MKIKKAINDIKEWFKKNESLLEKEPLTYWENGYIFNGSEISEELAPYSLMVYPIADAPTFADNRWEICCDIYTYNETGDLEHSELIIDGYSKNSLADAIIEAIKQLDL